MSGFHENATVDEDDYPWRLKKGNILKLSHEPVATKSRLAQCITDAMFGSRTLIGEILIRSGLKGFGSDKYSDSTLSPMQEERLQRLQERLHIQYDEDSLEHQKALIDLWHLAYPDVKLEGLISEQWKDMGWQGANPSTDFRGCGFISLENLLFFAKTFPVRALEFKPRSLPGANFLKLLEGSTKSYTNTIGERTIIGRHLPNTRFTGLQYTLQLAFAFISFLLYNLHGEHNLDLEFSCTVHLKDDV
ncbi:Engulfment/cell motility, ELMO [Cynara cardunculus var. scolymus]|uniref:Engulfment/cell motility, ELMO n=1 Tax=Cynara cardunculus var. scolymus TaxID=59895 RepID=A0A103XTN3_CYNCS|nr:Engulfment/cell motility, ELMO [Cynara cardunculus var. scolymus]